MLFKFLLSFYFIHPYHLSPKIKLQATWRQRQKLTDLHFLKHQAMGIGLSPKNSTCWSPSVRGGHVAIIWHEGPKLQFLICLLDEITLFLLADLLVLKKVYFFQLEQLKWQWVEESDHQPCTGQKQHWIISPRLSQRRNQVICSAMGELVIHGQSPWTN